MSGDDSIAAGDVVTISNTRVILGTQSEAWRTPGSDSGQARMTETEVTTKGVLRKADRAYDGKLIGIISTNPGVLMGSIDGEGKEDKRMLALSGRVPVKIDPDSPPIAVGDFLTSSSRPGLAAKATRPGYVVGRALEAWTPKSEIRNPKSETNSNDQNSNVQNVSNFDIRASNFDTIEAFLQLTYYMGDIDPWGNFRALEVDTLKVNKTLEVGGVNVMDRITKLEEEIRDLKGRLKH
ncbi:hypothetical protein HY949_04085 [Candidatus Gottesmanbacteria bacterium]|nr:hypothetical protein [Candidatus Gottesmanbacteria bacterium]